MRKQLWIMILSGSVGPQPVVHGVFFMGGLFGGGGSAPMPPVPPPVIPQPAPTAAMPAVQASAANQRGQAAAASGAGMGGTILTGPLGVVGDNNRLANAKLLGQ